MRETAVRWGVWIATTLLLFTLVEAQPVGVGHGMGGTSGEVLQQLAGSVHQRLHCASCHGRGPAMARSAENSCQGCHQQAAAQFRQGAHNATIGRSTPEVPTCVSCHGTHRVRAVHDPAAPTSAGQIPTACGKCHQQALDEFAASVHGRTMATGKLTTMPSCVTCHGAHEATPVRRERVAETCGSCHVEAQVAFQRSIRQARWLFPM